MPDDQSQPAGEESTEAESGERAGVPLDERLADLETLSAVLTECLGASDLLDSATGVEPLCILPATQKLIYSIFAPDQLQGLFSIAADQTAARKAAWTTLPGDLWSHLMTCFGLARQKLDDFRAMSSSEEMKWSLNYLINALKNLDSKELRRKVAEAKTAAAAAASSAAGRASPTSASEAAATAAAAAAAAARAAAEIMSAEPGAESFTIAKLTGKQPSLLRLLAALSSASWGLVEKFHDNVFNNNVEAQAQFDALFMSADGAAASEDQLILVETIMTIFTGKALTAEERKDPEMLAAHKRVGAAVLSVGRAMCALCTRGFNEFLTGLFIDPVVRRIWDKEETALMVMDLLKPAEFINKLATQLHKFYPLQRFAASDANELTKKASSEMVIKCLSGFAAFARGALGDRLGDNFDVNLVNLVTNISTHNENCAIFPGGAMGIVLTVIVPALQLGYVDVFNRRSASSFQQDSFSGSLAPGRHFSLAKHWSWQTLQVFEKMSLDDCLEDRIAVIPPPETKTFTTSKEANERAMEGYPYELFDDLLNFPNRAIVFYPT